ncbi:hypothetical protein GCM10027578_09610 [Spirosoma luteolum]
MADRTHTTLVDQEIKRLREFLKELYPDPDALTLMVSADEQAREQKALRQSLRTEEFYLIVDLVNLRIVEAAGLEQLGYNSASFTFQQYLNTIPNQGMLQLITLLGKQSFRLSDQAMLSFMNPKFIANIPMTFADGRVMLVKRTISTWQFTSEGVLTAYLSEFTIMHPYNNDPVNPRFLNLNPKIEAKFNSEVAQVFANLSAKLNPLSHQEINLLRHYVEETDGEVTTKQMADLAGITANTVRTHNQNIMTKAKSMFGDSMTARTAREVAFFLKKSGMLG